VGFGVGRQVPDDGEQRVADRDDGALFAAASGDAPVAFAEEGVGARDDRMTALNSRVIIEQAKGVLAVTGELTMDSAFTALRSYARRNNLRLSDVARTLADRELDPAVVLARSEARRAR